MINNKIAVHFYAPVRSASGYGVSSRQVMDYLLNDDRFIVFLQDVPWGNCPTIHEHDLEDKSKIHQYYQSMANYEQAQQQKIEYDISIYLTIPNEFQRRAKLCIGITAGIEVDRITREWVHKCNEMDLIVVPSTFSKNVLEATVYTIKYADGNVGQEKIVKPIHVIPHWFEKPKEIPEAKWDFPTKKNLLFVGLWGNKGGFGEDRKNISNLIAWFCKHFGSNPDYGLVLKTAIVVNSPEDLYATKEKIRQIKSNFKDVKAKIYLIHEHLSDAELWSLYKHPKITGFISLTNGEGFGLPLLEASAAGLPVIATNWSGHLDFLRPKNGFIPIDFNPTEIPECQIWKGVIDKGSVWASADEEDFKRKVKKFLESSKPVKDLAEKNVEWLNENFSKDVVLNKWKEFFNSFIQEQKEVSDPRLAQAQHHRRLVVNEVSKLLEKYNLQPRSDKKARALYVMPQSFGDIVISTAVINSLMGRHFDDEFYFATKPEYKELLDELKERYSNFKVIDFDDRLLQSELTREVWDYVYSPTVNVQYVFSGWTNGNGDYGVRLMEEFLKACNIGPSEVAGYVVSQKECNLPKKQYVSITPVSMKQSKEYKYWRDIVSNLKLMADVEVVQLGAKDEKMIDGCLDYRGKTFNETAYIVARSILHISPDTGTAHAAGALGVPHIVLFGSTSVHQCAPLLFNKRTKQVVIESLKCCQPKCYKDFCHEMPDGKNCLSHINPETVAEQAFNILKEIKEGKVSLPVLRLNKKELDAAVDVWHNTETGVEIHEHLGLSKENYSKYIENQYEEIK